MTPLLAALGLLTIWDIASTLYVLKRGGVELNPLLAKLFAAFPGKEALVLLAVKLVAVAAVGYAYYLGELPEWVVLGMVVLYAVVGLNNLKVVLKLR